MRQIFDISRDALGAGSSHNASDPSTHPDRRHLEEIASLYEVGQAVDPHDVMPLLNTVVTKAASVMDAQTCSLMLIEPGENTLVIKSSYGLADDIVHGARIAMGEGIAGRVAQTGEPVLIEDISHDPRFKDSIKPRPGVSGSMCVPLKDEEGYVKGVLSIRRHKPKPPFTQDDLKLFCVFATHASLAISNTHLTSRLNRKIEEMSRISEVLRAINSTLDLENVLDQIVESITDIVGFDRCCVYLLDTRANEFVAGARKGYDENDHVIDRVKPGEGVIGLAAKEQIPIFSQGSPFEPSQQGSGEFLAAPIVVRKTTIGVVVADNSVNNNAIEPEHVDLLATFVSQAGIAVENARLYEAMEEKYAELNVLYEHSRNISAAYGLDNASHMLVQTSAKAVGCDGAGLLLFDTKRGHLILKAFSGGLKPLAAKIEEATKNQKSVDFVRELKAPMLISPNDISDSEAYSELLQALAPGRTTLMLAPLVAEDTTIGAIVLYRNGGEAFESTELKLISIMASHAATVLKNAMTYEQKMHQRVLEMTALYEFSKKISSAANLEEALDSILAIVSDLADYDEAFIYAVDHDAGIASVKAARSRSKKISMPPDERLGGAGVVSWAVSEQKAIVSPDIEIDPRFKTEHLHKVRSLMAIPLILQDEVVGVMSVHNYSPNHYSDDDVRVLSIIASQGAAIYKELEALSALTSYTDNILSSIAAGVVTLDSDGMILTWNAAAENIVGIGVEKVVGMQYDKAMAHLKVEESEKQSLQKSIERVFKTGETYHGYKLAFHPTNNGDEVYINVSVSQLLNSASEQLGLVIIFEDITREIKMEDDFRRMGELAAVGQLAASIAHELRNPLSSIKGAAQFLQKEYEEEPAIVEFLGIIVDEVNGLNRLTTEFLDFARPMQLELKPACINDIVEKTLHLMSVHITDSNVVVKEDLAKSVPEIQADDSQLEQVLKNMIINSLQAMPEGGMLTIETGVMPAGGAFISVSDTGVGIAPDKVERIFQPFFTTKTKGTGLGLSVVHKIIENHGGRIEVTSKPNMGTTFKIVLPRSKTYSAIAADYDQTMERRM
ncbi:GAF domain-containing protein [bacterium]|nr:GAF domain-containing protein [bacterium]